MAATWRLCAASETAISSSFPAGTILAEPDAPNGGFSFPRVSPRGDAVAVFELGDRNSLVGRVVIVDRAGAQADGVGPLLQRVRARVAGRRGVVHRRGRLPLFRNTIYAMNAAGAARIITRVPGNTTLHDVAPDGRVLIARTDDRGGIAVRVPGETVERDLSWLDSSDIADISPDGRQILFYEGGVGGGPRQSTYLRGTDGSLAVRLGDGVATRCHPTAGGRSPAPPGRTSTCCPRVRARCGASRVRA